MVNNNSGIPDHGSTIGRQKNSIPRTTPGWVPRWATNNRKHCPHPDHAWRPEDVAAREQAIIEATMRIIAMEYGLENFLEGLEDFSETEAFQKNAASIGVEPADFTGIVRDSYERSILEESDEA